MSTAACRLLSSLLLTVLALSAPAARASEGTTMVFDLAPFAPPTVGGEIWGVGLLEGLVTDARLDLTYVSHDPGDWTLWIRFDDFPVPGFLGVDSVTEGWTGAGTWSKTVETGALTGLYEVPDGAPAWSWFLMWAGGHPVDLPGGGVALLPVDGEFTELTLTLTFAACPFGVGDRAWTDLGGAVAGAGGAPSLSAEASLCPGEDGSLTLAGGPPGGSSTLVLGLSELAAPFKGGVLVPQPDLLLPGLALDAAGGQVLPFSWPVGLGSGWTFAVQHWMADGTAPFGWAASNALRGSVP